jgi:hypothetical protein
VRGGVKGCVVLKDKGMERRGKNFSVGLVMACIK